MDRQILFVFKVGHSVQRRAKPLCNRTHHWRCYLDTWNPNYPLSAFVRKVTFWLHDTFDNPRQVVRQAPFAIEEDGFGHFQLQIEVAFLDCVTTFTYDLRLFDNNELHTYRTVRVTPAPEDWDRMIQLGGIVIPRNNTPADIHKVVQTIQSCSNLESMHPYSFFPQLDLRLEHEMQSLSPASVGSIDQRPSDSTSLHPELAGVPSTGQDHFTDYQDESCSGSLTHSDPDVPRHSMLSVDRLLAQKPLPQKHKKKLQLLHEAQLLLEDAQKRQSQWASSRPVTASGSGSPQYNLMPLSPDIPNPSKRASSRDSVGDQDVPGTSLVNTILPVSKDPKDNSVSRSVSDDRSASGNTESHSPVKRIVLKLSRLGSGNPLVVTSSDPEGQEVPDERQERRRRKKEHRKEQARIAESQTTQTTSVGFKPEKVTSRPEAPINQDECIAVSHTTEPVDVQSPRKMKKHKRTKGEKHSFMDSANDSYVSMASKVNLTEKQPASSVKREGGSLKHHVSSKGVMTPPYAETMDVTTDAQPKSEFDRHVEPFVEHELFGSDDESHPMSQQTNQFSPKASSPFEHGAHSHLLLDNPDEEFDDALSRSLFSQCHDSTNPDSPVDLFGDEDRLSSSHTTPHLVDVGYTISSPNESNGSRPYDPEDPVASKPGLVGGELCEDTGDECIPLSRHSSTDRSEKSSDLVRAGPVVQVVKSRPSKTSTDSSASGADHGRSLSASHKKHKKLEKQKSKMKDDQQKSTNRKQQSIISPDRSSASSLKIASEKTESVILHSHPVNVPMDLPEDRIRSPLSHSSSTSCEDTGRQNISTDHSKHARSRLVKPKQSVEPQPSPQKHQMQKVTPIGESSKPVCVEEPEPNKRKLPDSKKLDPSDVSKTKAKKPELKKHSRSQKPPTEESESAPKSKGRSQSDHRRTNSVPSDSKHSPPYGRNKFSKRFKEQDIELSSLSSSSTSSVSSSPTPPMSSCNSLLVGSTTEPETMDKHHASPPKPVVQSKATKLSREKSTKKKNNPQLSGSSTTVTAQLQTPSISTEKLNPFAKSGNLEPIKPSAVSEAPQLSDAPRDQSKYSGQQLEHLFDRLLRLQQPHLAIRMSEILLQHLAPRSPTPASKLQASEPTTQVGSKTKSNRAVKVLNEGEPRVIAFNLRRLPLACLDQLCELIAEDEAISAQLDDRCRTGNSTGSEPQTISASKDLGW